MRNKSAYASWRDRARALKRETYALYLAIRDPATPWYAKVLGALVVGYALSPIDLIPDFIPILGHLDDLILVPAGIALTLKLIPPEVMSRCRERAATELAGKRLSAKRAAIVIVLVWLIAISVTTFAIIRLSRH